MMLGSAFSHEVLKPSAIFCKILQEDEVCVVRTIEAILKMVCRDGLAWVKTGLTILFE